MVLDGRGGATPDVIGITNLFYTQMPQALETARVARRVLPDVPVVELRV